MTSRWRLGKDALKIRKVYCLRSSVRSNGFIFARNVTSAPQLPQLKRIVDVLPPRGEFSRRHIGPRESEIKEMLDLVGIGVSRTKLKYIIFMCICLTECTLNRLQSLEELTKSAVPEDILLDRPLNLDEPNCKDMYSM